MLQSLGFQRVGHDVANEQQQNKALRVYGESTIKEKAEQQENSGGLQRVPLCIEFNADQKI